MNDLRVRQKEWRDGSQFLSLGIKSLWDSLGWGSVADCSYNNKKHWVPSPLYKAERKIEFEVGRWLSLKCLLYKREDLNPRT